MVVRAVPSGRHLLISRNRICSLDAARCYVWTNARRWSQLDVDDAIASSPRQSSWVVYIPFIISNT
jgi:hypothetical protein